MNFFITPSITAIYNNNPSYSELEIIENENDKSYMVKNIYSHSMSLKTFQLYHGQRWITMDWQNEFGFDINKASTIKSFYQRMMNDFNLFSRYEAACYGMNWFET